MPNLIKYSQNPFLSLQHELNRTFHNVHNLLSNSSMQKEMESMIISPSIDIVDDKENFKVEAEMPGLDENDITVSIGDSLLTIKGEKTVSQKNHGKNYLMREIGYGCYERNIPLPDCIDADKAKASFKKGMLWINIPKKAGESNKNKLLKVEKAS